MADNKAGAATPSTATSVRVAIKGAQDIDISISGVQPIRQFNELNEEVNTQDVADYVDNQDPEKNGVRVRVVFDAYGKKQYISVRLPEWYFEAESVDGKATWKTVGAALRGTNLILTGFHTIKLGQPLPYPVGDLAAGEIWAAVDSEGRQRKQFNACDFASVIY
tara:strand:- start:23611 stop:24102 length:492 start_codon:yes stop_codon:yes gene_type:complete